jgi:penicillin-binding protein 2
MEIPPQSSLSRPGREEKLSPNKLHAAQYVVAMVLAVLLAGLWRLQILGASNYRVLAEANRIRKVPVAATQAPVGN